MKIIKIEERHIPRGAEVLTIAFEHDPIFRYIYGNVDRYKKSAPWLFASWIKWAVRFGEAWMNEEQTAVVMTRKIGDGSMSFGSMVQAGMLATPFKMSPAAFYRFYFKILPALDKNHAKIMGNISHIYGWMIGATEPGKGLGKPMLNHVRDIADEKKLPIFLETATMENLSLYNLYDFSVKGEKKIDADCTICFLVRQPQTPVS